MEGNRRKITRDEREKPADSTSKHQADGIVLQTFILMIIRADITTLAVILLHLTLISVYMVLYTVSSLILCILSLLALLFESCCCSKCIHCTQF